MYEVDGKAIQENRERCFLSQRELAEKAGMTQSTISRLELGKQQARAGSIRKIADVLGVMPDALIVKREE